MAPKNTRFLSHVSYTDQQVDKPSVSEPVEFVKLSAKMGYSKSASRARFAKKGRAERKRVQFGNR